KHRDVFDTGNVSFNFSRFYIFSSCVSSPDCTRSNWRLTSISTNWRHKLTHRCRRCFTDNEATRKSTREATLSRFYQVMCLPMEARDYDEYYINWFTWCWKRDPS